MGGLIEGIRRAGIPGAAGGLGRVALVAGNKYLLRDVQAYEYHPPSAALIVGHRRLGGALKGR